AFSPPSAQRPLRQSHFFVVFVIFVVKDPAMLRWVLIAALALAHAPAHADDTLPTCGNPAVILIVVDTLRADHLGTYGSARFTSPRPASQLRRGAVLAHAFGRSPWCLA